MQDRLARSQEKLLCHQGVRVHLAQVALKQERIQDLTGRIQVLHAKAYRAEQVLLPAGR